MPKSVGLPPGLIIKTGRLVWTTLWRTMMSKLAPRDKSGAYVRPESAFRHWVETKEQSLHPAAAERYELIVGMSCPWAHRTLVTRALKGLEKVVSVTVVAPSDSGVWAFEEPLEGCDTLPEFYRKLQPGYQGRSTVPVLWDRSTHTIVNNESADIIEILNQSFDAFAENAELDLAPKELRSHIAHWNSLIYPNINNGVYRCGFAQTQAAYETACTELFETLDTIEKLLSAQRYLGGDQITLADVRLFTTLIRFDVAYHTLFKCNRRRLQDYPSLSGYLRDIYQLPGVAATCDIEAVKRDYFGNLFPLNPGGIVPLGPDLEGLTAPHGRAELAAIVNHTV